MSIKIMAALALAVMHLVTGCSSEIDPYQIPLSEEGEYQGYHGWYADYLMLQDCGTDWECEVAEARLCESYPESDPLDMQELVCE